VRRWLLVVHGGHTINIAGPRESKSPGVHARAREFLLAVLGGREELASTMTVRAVLRVRYYPAVVGADGSRCAPLWEYRLAAARRRRF
jgi:hypothetical protein